MREARSPSVRPAKSPALASKGFRFYLLADDRIVQVPSWHQIHTDEEAAEALHQVKAAGLIPEEQVRLCVVADGARWIWKQAPALFPAAVACGCTTHVWRLCRQGDGECGS